MQQSVRMPNVHLIILSIKRESKWFPWKRNEKKVVVSSARIHRYFLGKIRSDEGWWGWKDRWEVSGWIREKTPWMNPFALHVAGLPLFRNLVNALVKHLAIMWTKIETYLLSMKMVWFYTAGEVTEGLLSLIRNAYQVCTSCYVLCINLWFCW